MTTNSQIYIFAGGGTGGHLYPGLAVAAELSERLPDAKFVFACSRRPVDRRILDATPYAIVPQPVRPLPKTPSQWPGFLGAWFASLAQGRDLIRDLQPTAVLGLGGFAAGPVCRKASAAGVPTALLNPDAVPGKANRYLARHCDVIFTQFESTAETFGRRLGDRVRCVGCPVRRELTAAGRDEAVEHFSLRADRKTLLIFGGSLMSASINAAVVAMEDELKAFAERWQILHVTGPDFSAGRWVEGGVAVRTLEYCDRMDLAWAAADLAVCRGGASTMAELTATGTPAIILPYPHHRDRQQQRNAQAFVSAGAGVCVIDAQDTALNVASLRATLLPLLGDPPRLDAMGRAAVALARPDAAATVADWLAGHAESQ